MLFFYNRFIITLVIIFESGDILANYVFERYEYKYIITRKQYFQIKELLANKLIEDSYGKTTIQSLYYDTNDYLLIRRSIERPIYKEKIRLRGYGVVDSESKVFLEIKKKSEGVVYKRRVRLKEKEAVDFFYNDISLDNGQIGNEINYFKKYYGDLKPAMLLIYDREALFDLTSDLRITFDSNIRYRDYDLTLDKGFYGENLIDNDLIIMEIKTAFAIPFYLARFLSENQIFKTPFSKYGTAYKKLFKEKKLWMYLDQSLVAKQQQ